MKTIYELRCSNEIVGVFPTEKKAAKAMLVYIKYLEVNNGLSVDNIPPRIDKYSMVRMSNDWRLFIIERDLFTTVKKFSKYIGL